MRHAYRQHATERAALGIAPLPLSAVQTAAWAARLQAPPPFRHAQAKARFDGGK